ncbi:hypothetical protein M8818_002378 [Zalaria obscura]|uniref:Uncharacterized protein n=1 Tax=Zalaria obscura TaxID=2024903 RepID=A0ACC3SHL5_9PEZI
MANQTVRTLSADTCDIGDQSQTFGKAECGPRSASFPPTPAESRTLGRGGIIRSLILRSAHERGSFQMQGPVCLPHGVLTPLVPLVWNSGPTLSLTLGQNRTIPHQHSALK